MKKNVSPFFYIHPDMAGDTSWNKIGVGITPHSVVRARQKYTSKYFYLSHLYFGEFTDITMLERVFKNFAYTRSAKFLLGSSATELYNISESHIVVIVNAIISEYKLKIKKIKLPEKYSSPNSKCCTLNIPGEKIAYPYLKNLILNNFDTAFNYEELSFYISDTLRETVNE